MGSSVKIPGSKEKLLDGINDVLESVPDIGSKNIQINMRIQREFRTLLGQRIQARFHASYSDSSQTSQSGWELYYTNRNGEEASIQTDDDFREYILDTFELSCEHVKAYLSDESRSFQQQRQGANFPSEALCSHLRDILNKEGLIEGIVSNVNNEQGKKVLHREPAWFIRSGGFATDVLQGYYGTPPAGKTTTAHTSSIKVFGNSFPSQLVNNIKKGIEASGLTSLPKNITTIVPGHVLNIVTQTDPKMQAILESETPLMELKELFYEPGKALYAIKTSLRRK